MTDQQPPPKSLGTVLVIGGCGFLGSNVVDQLLNFPSEDEIYSTTSAINGLTNNPNPSIHLSTTPRPDPATLTFPSLRSRYPSYTNTTVHALDLRCTRNRYPGATYHEADITSPTSLLAVFKTVKPDVIINTASPTFDAPEALLKKVNIDGTRTLIEVAGGAHGSWGGKCKAFVHTSSASVIHDTLSDLINADESYPYVDPNPREYYSQTKVHAERLVLAANGQSEYSGMLTCAIRPAGIVGEGDRSGISYSVSKTASIAPSWQLHFQLGEGDNLFDTTYVGNVVYAHLLAAERLVETYERKAKGLASPLDHERVDGEAFIVTNDSPAYFWDTTRFLWQVYGRDVNVDKVLKLPKSLAMTMGALSQGFNWLAGREGRITPQTVRYSCMHRYYSCEKLKRRCGYLPVVGIQEGLERSVRWFVWDERGEKEKGGLGKKEQ
jgi:sterol-4alpha-carboxylate 3-dehydrogenase (decarboxylating)